MSGVFSSLRWLLPLAFGRAPFWQVRVIYDALPDAVSHSFRKLIRDVCFLDVPFVVSAPFPFEAFPKNGVPTDTRTARRVGVPFEPRHVRDTLVGRSEDVGQVDVVVVLREVWIHERLDFWVANVLLARSSWRPLLPARLVRGR